MDTPVRPTASKMKARQKHYYVMQGHRKRLKWFYILTGRYFDLNGLDFILARESISLSTSHCPLLLLSYHMPHLCIPYHYYLGHTHLAYFLFPAREEL